MFRWYVRTALWLLLALGALYFGWLPRIVARRLEAERREDPDAAARRQRRDRVIGIIGYIGGALSGGAGLIAGLWSVLTGP